MPSARSTLPAWQKLVEHQQAAPRLGLRGLFASDPGRFQKFSLSACGIFVDWSKQLVTADTMRLLAALARECGLEQSVKRLHAGERVNATENRPALHTALRAPGPVVVNGRDVTRDVKDVLAAMTRFVQGVHTGSIRGAGRRAFTDVLHLGIGGSDLGPRLACEALAPYARSRPRLHFVSNVDGAAISSALAALDPRTTLVVVASKTFTTQETLANARVAKSWLRRGLRSEAAAAKHLCAVTAEPARAVEFGIPADRVFRIWEWVGGRYSLWSAVGLPVALATGMKHFNALRAGAAAMDAHFATAPQESSMPVVMGLLDVWNASFRGATSRVVLPYDERLRLLPAYLQQLEMESCGKRVTPGGKSVDYATAPAVWGGTGTDVQHAWFQWLHQGTRSVTADFIACRRPRHPLRDHHDLLLANFLAQSEALAFGQTEEEAAADMRSHGRREAEIRGLLPHRVFDGNLPSTSIVLDDLSPQSLGALLALHEHRVFVQSVIWDVNAFDQWGVELGKRLAGRILPELAGVAPAAVHDTSTAGLIRHLKKPRRKA